MSKEVTLIMIIILLGVLVLALTIAVVWLSRKIIWMSDRVNAVDDYILTKFLTNERQKQNEEGRTGESS
jgi:flagellar basal body-associated protein FliL